MKITLKSTIESSVYGPSQNNPTKKGKVSHITRVSLAKIVDLEPAFLRDGTTIFDDDLQYTVATTSRPGWAFSCDLPSQEYSLKVLIKSKELSLPSYYLKPDQFESACAALLQKGWTESGRTLLEV